MQRLSGPRPRSVVPGRPGNGSSNGRRLAPRRPTGPDAMGRLPLPPAASAVRSRRGRRLSGPDPRNLNPPSFGHFVKDVTGPLLSSCARLTGGRPKRCVRSGAAASVHGMRPFSGPAASRMACGRSGVGTRRRIGRNGVAAPQPRGDRLLLPSSTRGRRTPSRRAPRHSRVAKI